MTPLLSISTGTLALIVIVLIVDIFVIMFLVSFNRSRRRGTEEGKGPKPISRREFLRRSLLSSLAVFGAQFGAATIAFLWPNLKGGFGSVINAGKVDDIKNQINQTNQPFYFGSGRFYIVPYSGTGKDPATGIDYVTQGVVSDGLMPLYQRCAHLGCRVPFCLSSKWFECPCHGSKYNEAGEWQLGPAPTGMQRFKITVTGGDVMVDTSDVSTPGPPRGTDTIHEPPQGPFCVAPG
ncbi:MAG: ubiquinol-cytochrome c reductase iron-sulfur subunit [Actinomycetota bacterium]